eukprot:8106859-Alexandrium_andersonii.AAC.1
MDGRTDRRQDGRTDTRTDGLTDMHTYIRTALAHSPCRCALLVYHSLWRRHPAELRPRPTKRDTN